MKTNLEVLAFAQSHPLWDDFAKDLLEKRPRIPVHDPSDDNTAQWKEMSAMRKGFDLALHHLKIEVNKNE